MGRIDRDRLVQEFIERTRANQKIIDRQAILLPGAVFEFTQCVNSMLGLLILPQQKHYRELNKVSLNEPAAAFLPPVEYVSKASERIEFVGDYAKHLRNGFAHWNIEFLDDGQVLTGVIIANRRQNRVTHRFKFEERDLRRFATEFPTLLEEALDRGATPAVKSEN